MHSVSSILTARNNHLLCSPFPSLFRHFFSDELFYTCFSSLQTNFLCQTIALIIFVLMVSTAISIYVFGKSIIFACFLLAKNP